MPIDQNPADCATRSVPAAHLLDTMWLSGPVFLSSPTPNLPKKDSFELVDPILDAEIHPQVSTLNTSSSSMQLGSQRFTKFSTWTLVNRAIAHLIDIIHTFCEAKAIRTSECKGWHHCQTACTVKELSQSKDIIIQAVQEETYVREFSCIKN